MTSPDDPVTDVPGSSAQPGVVGGGMLTIADQPVDAPAISISEALASGGEPVRVIGSLLVDPEGTVLLCDALAESFPPQCGGERLEVIGLDVESVPNLEEGNGVRWAGSVELSGTVD